MRYLRTYENQESNVFNNFIKLKDELEKEYEKLKDIIKEFLSYERGLLPELLRINPTDDFIVKDFYARPKYNTITIYISYGGGEVDYMLALIKEDFNNLIEFSRDPELYKSSKKYNL